MRIASPFQRGTGPGTGTFGRGVVCSLFACSVLGCVFGLEDVVPAGIGGSSGSGGNGTSGTGGFPSIGGDAAVGGVGGTPVDPGCPAGQQDCGNGCVPLSIENGCGAADCTPCAPLQQATLRCNIDNRACEVADCAPGFADCNGDTSSYTGQPGGDGCEYSFGPNGELRAAPEALDVPLVHNISIVDGERGDWTGIPAYPLLVTCDDCVDSSVPVVTVPNVVPPRDDLDAYFRVAWDEAYFYLLGDVYDTSVVADGALREGNCQEGQLCEDSLTVLVDGHNDRSVTAGPQPDDLYLFVAMGGKAYRYAQAPVRLGTDMDFKATLNGAACYRIEARFTWAYMTNTQPGQPIDPQFAPEVGKQYGFDVAVNDWDPGVSDPEPQRESQLFWVSPGNGYQQNTSNFGAMTLTDGVANGSGTPE